MSKAVNSKRKVPVGYKQTAVGVFPSAWKIEKLGSVTLDSAFGPRFSSDLYSNNGKVATLRTTDMDSNGNLDLSRMPLARLNIEDIQAHLLQKNDLVISRSGTIGITGVFPGHHIPVIPGAFLIRFRLDTNRIEPTYLKSYFHSSDGKRRVLNLAGGGVQKNLSGTSLLNLFIPIPSLPEQQKIAAILTTWDEAIEKTQKLIDQLKQRNKGLAQQLLTGKKRLKGFSGEWKELRADHIFKNHTDKSHDGKLEVLSATQEQGVIPRSMVNIDIKYDEGSLDTYKKVEKGDFVISLRSFQGGIEYSDYEGLVSPAYTVLKEVIAISKLFFRVYFKTETFINRLNTIIYGIRDGKQIGYKDFATLKLPFPSVQEQHAIALVLDQAGRELKLHEQKLATLQQQKKGLMQKLLTGEVRVKTE